MMKALITFICVVVFSVGWAAPKDPGRGRRPPRPTGGDAGTPGGAATVPTSSPATIAATGPTTGPLNEGGGPREGRRGNRPFGFFVYGGPGAIPANEPDAQLKSRFLGFNATGSFIDEPGIGGAQIFRNRLRLREGPGAIDAEHLGGLAAGIHASLLDSTPEEATGEPRIEVFTDAWPRSWDCSFKLLARGGFVVSASLKSGEIEFVKVESPLGGLCRLKNPWPNHPVTLQRTGGESQTINGDWIAFNTVKQEAILLKRR